MLDFLRETREELKKVVWPSRDEVLGSTLVVLAAVILISIFLFIVDHGFEAIFNWLVRWGTGGAS